MCLGANYVGIGRPAIFGLIVNGHKGVENIFKILENELFTSMINGGFDNYKSLSMSRLIFTNRYEKIKSYLYYTGQRWI